MELIEKTRDVPRPEHPNPQFRRHVWTNLNGVWEFEKDPADVGMSQQWYLDRPLRERILVPFPPESPLSGIGDRGLHDVVWYRRTFAVDQPDPDSRVLLHFGAVDYQAQVWLNGQLATVHEGGHTPFSADVTPLVRRGENVLVVRAEDRARQLDQPRGKQYWKEASEGIFYTRTTGIWQTVWLETVSSRHIGRLRLTPDVDHGEIRLDAVVEGMQPGDELRLEVEIRFGNEVVATDILSVLRPKVSRRIGLGDFHVHSPGRLWSPEHPNLYDITLRLRRGEAIADEVHSYFGMRKISVENGRIFLNNRPYYMKLVLDQGYYPDGILTPPSDEAIRRDVEWVKQLGFNGVRKHQKIEDPRYLYWCDRLGLLVWGEMPSSHLFTEDSVRRLTSEWQEAVERDYNHPCIVVWVPFNESWGISEIAVDRRQPYHALALYALTKCLDETRLVVSNDGWEHTWSDLCTIHDYDADPDSLRRRYATVEAAISGTPARRLIYAPGFSHRGEPILVTEFGGICLKDSGVEGWGYSGADTASEFIQKYRELVRALLDSPVVQGFCYTQFTDVEQETNGLLTYDRQPKVDVEVIRAINEGRA